MSEMKDEVDALSGGEESLVVIDENKTVLSRIFLGNLPLESRPADLERELTRRFVNFGKVLRVHVPADKEVPDRCRGCAFVELEAKHSNISASFKAYKNSKWRGKRLRMEIAERGAYDFEKCNEVREARHAAKEVPHLENKEDAETESNFMEPLTLRLRKPDGSLMTTKIPASGKSISKLLATQKFAVQNMLALSRKQQAQRLLKASNQKATKLRVTQQKASDDLLQSTIEKEKLLQQEIESKRIQKELQQKQIESKRIQREEELALALGLNDDSMDPQLKRALARAAGLTSNDDEDDGSEDFGEMSEESIEIRELSDASGEESLNHTEKESRAADVLHQSIQPETTQGPARLGNANQAQRTGVIPGGSSAPLVSESNLVKPARDNVVGAQQIHRAENFNTLDQISSESDDEESETDEALDDCSDHASTSKSQIEGLISSSVTEENESKAGKPSVEEFKAKSDAQRRQAVEKERNRKRNTRKGASTVSGEKPKVYRVLGSNAETLKLHNPGSSLKVNLIKAADWMSDESDAGDSHEGASKDILVLGGTEQNTSEFGAALVEDEEPFVREIFLGDKGHEMFQLEKSFGGDTRFKLDSRFLDSSLPNSEQLDENRERSKRAGSFLEKQASDSLQEERTRLLDILDLVVPIPGAALTRFNHQSPLAPNADLDALRKQNYWIAPTRFDPTKTENSIQVAQPLPTERRRQLKKKTTKSKKQNEPEGTSRLEAKLAKKRLKNKKSKKKLRLEKRKRKRAAMAEAARAKEDPSVDKEEKMLLQKVLRRPVEMLNPQLLWSAPSVEESVLHNGPTPMELRTNVNPNSNTSTFKFGFSLGPVEEAEPVALPPLAPESKMQDSPSPAASPPLKFSVTQMSRFSFDESNNYEEANLQAPTKPAEKNADAGRKNISAKALDDCDFMRNSDMEELEQRWVAGRRLMTQDYKKKSKSAKRLQRQKRGFQASRRKTKS